MTQPISINVQYTEGLHHGGLTEHPMTWSRIINQVKNPLNLWDGTEAQLWSFYKVRDNPVIENGLICGIKNNMEYVLCIQLDYDDGFLTIDDFIKKHKDYRFVLYTTKSNSPTHNKFRVILPLNTPILNSVYSSKSCREYLRDMFPYTDSTTFDGWRKQRLPHITPDTIEYKYHVNKGKGFDLDNNVMQIMYEGDVQLRSFQQSTTLSSIEIDVFNTPFEEWDNIRFINNLMNIYTPELESINWTNRSNGEDVHSRSRKCIYSLRSNGMNSDDVYAYIMDIAPNDDKIEKEMYDLCYGDIK